MYVFILMHILKRLYIRTLRIISACRNFNIEGRRNAPARRTSRMSAAQWRCATARAVEIANRCIKIHTCMLAPDHTKGNIQSYEYAYKHAYDSAHIGAASDAAARLTSRSEQLEVAPWLQTQTAPEEHTGARTLNVKARAHGGWPMFGKTHRERRTPTVSMHLMSRPGHMEAGPCLKI